MFMHKNTIRGAIAKEVIAFKKRWDRKRGTNIGGKESFARYIQSLKAGICILLILSGVFCITAITAITDFNEMYEKLDKEGLALVLIIMFFIVYNIFRDLKKVKIAQEIIEHNEDENVINDYDVNHISE